MPGTISQGALSASQIVAPGLYVQILPPPSTVSGVPSNIGAVIGSAAWGPVGQPVLCGSTSDVTRNFGPIPNANAFGSGIGTTLDATANPYDLVQEANMAYTQARSGATFALWCLRAVDGTNYAQGGTPGTGGSGQNTTGAYASLQLVDTSAANGLVLYGLYLGTLGNGITITTVQGSRGAGFITVTVTPPPGLGMNQEVYPNIPIGLKWASSTAYTTSSTPIVPSGAPNFVFAVKSTTSSGDSGSSQPTWNTTIGGTTVDNEVTWVCVGTIGPYSYFGSSYASQFWPNLAASILNGVANVRGPSLLLYAPQVGTSISGQTAPSTTAVAPAIITGSYLTGGIDGSTYITSGYGGTNNLPVNMVGSSAAYPYTGAYLLGALNPPVSHFRLAGFGESSGDVTNAGTKVQAIADSIGAIFWCGFPLGDDSATTTATSAVVTAGIDDFEWVYVKDHNYWADGVHAPRFVPQAPFTMGDTLSIAPQASPLNTAIQGVIGTYRSVSQGAPAPYSQAEIGACQLGRITLVANPSPGGAYTGLNTAVNSSSNPVTSPIEYGTLTNNIAKTLAANFGQFVGQLQSPVNPQDPTRQAVQDSLNNYLTGLVTSNVIAAGFAVCDLTNNTAATIAAHFLFATAQATYLASIWFFLLSFTGGTTVQVQVRQGPPA